MNKSLLNVQRERLNWYKEELEKEEYKKRHSLIYNHMMPKYLEAFSKEELVIMVIDAMEMMSGLQREQIN